MTHLTNASEALLAGVPAKCLHGRLGSAAQHMRGSRGRRYLAVVQVREFDEADWPPVWEIIREVVQARDTFTYDPGMEFGQGAPDVGRGAPRAGRSWRPRTAASSARRKSEQPPRPGCARLDGELHGRRHRARGQGVGTALFTYAVDWAKREGYAGMQFNAVVDSNRTAVELYLREQMRSSARSRRLRPPDAGPGRAARDVPRILTAGPVLRRRSDTASKAER